MTAGAAPSPWLTYEEAAAYTKLAHSTLHKLVSARRIPVYGSRHRRRFNREMLDLWIRDHDLAMRKWHEEHNSIAPKNRRR